MKFGLFIFLLAPVLAMGSDGISENLAARWQMYEADSTEDETHTRAMQLTLRDSDIGSLFICHEKAFALFINNELVKDHVACAKWSLDSLKKIYVFPIRIAVFAEEGLNGLSARLDQGAPLPDRRDPINNFDHVITIDAFLLVALFLVLAYTNGAVLSEYFGFIRVFSFRATDDSAQIQRITSINNVFIYAFLSLLIATNLVVFREWGHGRQLEAAALVKDIFLFTCGVFCALLFKIVIVNISSYLFHQSESGPAQFFNFVRLMLGIFLISSIGLLFSFVTAGRGEPWRTVLVVTGLVLLSAFIIATFMRLLGKGGHTAFHLFSYICISEICPALLLLNSTVH